MQQIKILKINKYDYITFIFLILINKNGFDVATVLKTAGTALARLFLCNQPIPTCP